MTKLKWAVTVFVGLLLICIARILMDAGTDHLVKIGFSQSFITPNLSGHPRPEIFLPGKPYNKRASSIQSELSVRAIVLDDGKEKVALVSCDCFGLFRIDVEKIRAEVRDIFPEGNRVIVSSTHTHSAPDTTGIYSDARANHFMLAYINEVIQKSARAIRDAYKSRLPFDFR